MTLKFVINRSEWLRGPMCSIQSNFYIGPSGLWNAPAKCGCCLGLVSRDMGVPISVLSGYGEPEELFGLVDTDVVEGFDYLADVEEDDYCPRNTKLSGNAIDINDDTTISEEQREQALIKEFADSYIELEFVGPYASWDARRDVA